MRKIRVKVKPNSRVNELGQTSDGAWQARIKAPPVDGKANDELLKLIARHFGVRKSQVTIKSGRSARTKVVQIAGGVGPP